MEDRIDEVIQLLKKIGISEMIVFATVGTDRILCQVPRTKERAATILAKLLGHMRLICDFSDEDMAEILIASYVGSEFFARESLQ